MVLRIMTLVPFQGSENTSTSSIKASINAKPIPDRSNSGLVWSIVRRFSNRGYELEELFQVGSIGLMKAIDKFDASFSVKFSTYAVPLITGDGFHFSICLQGHDNFLSWKPGFLRQLL